MQQGDGNSDKGSRQATATVTKIAVVTVTRVASKDEGDGKGGKSNEDGDKEGNWE